MARKTKATLEADKLDVVADRGYFNGEEIPACDEAGITATPPKPMTSGNKAKGRFVKADFRCLAGEGVYICPAGEQFKYDYANEEKGLTPRRYWTNACRTRAIKHRCTTGVQRRITRWNTSMFWRPSSAGWTRTHKPCVSAVRRSSIPSARSRHGWGRRTS
jgi:transposase